MSTHGLERTSPKGGPFLGRCVYCGATDLRSSAALETCDKAPHQDQQVLDAISGPVTEKTPSLPARFTLLEEGKATGSARKSLS